MNSIKLTPLYKEDNSTEFVESEKIITIDIEPVTHIKPEILLQYDPSIKLDKLYGFKANITCDYRAKIIIGDFIYFALASFEDGETTLSHMKVHNISGSFRLNRIKIDRLDVENSDSLLVECNVHEAYIGIENYYRRLENQEPKIYDKGTVDIRGCTIEKLCSYSQLSSLNLQDTMIKRLEVQNDTDRILIWQYSQIEYLLLSRKIGSFRIQDSKVDAIRGTSGLFIKQFENYYSNILSVYNIFENNINGSSEEVYRIIRMSYCVQKNYGKYAMYSYLISNAHLESEKSIGTKIPLIFLKLSCGFGYRVSNAIGFSLGIIMLFSIFYFSLTCFGNGSWGLGLPSGIITTTDKVFYSIYHSIVTFATLGYGDTFGLDWITRFLSGMESLIGIFSMSIIIYTLTRKYSNFQ